ncbi:C-C chemokine receptor type 5-like [Pseudophryne corroboree]|uniref:C-C chemokine receptor type 5-like n=1 Tax=Pseudophryne corroboree TaxID=495146 RepID=UPI0030816C3B
MEASKREDNSTTDNCTEGLNIFRIPQVTNEDCKHINVVAAQIFSDIFYVLTFTAIAINILKILSTVRGAQKWTTSHIYLVNIAAAHIIFLLPCPVWGMYLNQQYDWHLGKYACSIMNFTNALGHFGGTLLICIICVDRVVSIHFPVTSIQYKNVKFGKMVVMTSWTLSTVIASLSYVYTPFTVYGGSKHLCGAMNIGNALSFASVWSFTMFFVPNILIPTVVIVPCFVKIMVYLCCQQTRLPYDMGKVIKLDIAYISSFLILCLSSSYAILIVCFVYLTSPSCHDKCRWANVINLLSETARLLNVFNAVISPFIYLSKFKLGLCTSLCDCTNLKLCSCECSQQPPALGIQTLQLVYIPCVTDDHSELKINAHC